MKPYKIYILFSLIFLFIISCKKGFLEVPDKTVLTRQFYVTDLATTHDYLNGIYVNLATNFFKGEGIIYPEIIADNIKPVTGSLNLAPHYSWTQHADENASVLNRGSSNTNGLWNFGYRIIRDCSFVLETVGKYRSEDPQLADNIKGQAYGLRALVHFVLVNIFAQSYSFTADGSHAGIPYITSTDLSKPVFRQAVAEVYNSMVADLDNAIPLLPANSKSTLVFNRNAAQALLARIYLFKGSYTKAKDLAREVGTNVPILTGEDYPSKLFTGEEAEALFQLPPSARGVAGGAGDYSAVFAGRWFVESRPTYTSTNDIATMLHQDTNDVRNRWVSETNSGWIITKYPKDVIPGFPNVADSYYQTLLRSSEMYLTAAEAYARLNNEDSAKFYLDAIRKRANPLLESTAATGALLLNAIYEERRKELAFEGLRMFDLQRWKMNVIRMDATDPMAQKLSFPDNRAIAPIPRQDVNLSGLQQNAGY